MKEKNNGIITKKIAKEAILQSFKKLNPKDMIKNPVMFVAYVGVIITAILTVIPNSSTSYEGRIYNGIVTIIYFSLYYLLILLKVLQKEEERLKRIL